MAIDRQALPRKARFSQSRSAGRAVLTAAAALLVAWRLCRGLKVQEWNQLDTSPPCPSEKEGSSYQLAYEQSFGFFDDISDADWESFYRRPAQHAQHYQEPRNYNRDHDASYWNFHNWDPYFTCPHVQKLGGLGGAAKWTCDVERVRRMAQERQRQAEENDQMLEGAPCLVYSIGSRNNFLFENALAEQVGALCEVHVFDPDPWSETPIKFVGNYHQVGLKSSYSLDYRKNAPQPHKTFQEIQANLGHENRTIDIFKIDCEGCEWHTYKDWITADIRQVLVETHEIPLADRERRTDFGVLPAMPASDFFDTFQSNGFILFSKEVNSQKGTGRSVEWSFLRLRKDFLQLTE